MTRSHRRRWSARRKVITSLVMLVLVVAGIAGAGYWDVQHQWSRVHKVACRACTHVADGKPYNVLLIGSDTRAGNTGQAARSFGTASAIGGQRSDTIKILHVDPSSGTARMLSIPRDTYVTMSGLAPSTGLVGAQKINAAFNNGPEALIETIQNTFGIPISHWIVVDFDGVVDAVEALGGISLDFTYPVRDDNDGVNESGLDITRTGCQVLDGNATLSLARSRYYEYYADGAWHLDPGYDISRIQRQDTVIEAMMARARSTYNPLELQSLVKSVASQIAVDDKMSLGMIYDLVQRYHAFSLSDLQSWTLPTTGEYTPSQSAVEVVSTGAVANYVDTITQFLGGSPGPVTTPPLDQYGEPVSVPPAPTSTISVPPPPAGHAAAPTTTAPASTTTTLPPYDPTVC